MGERAERSERVSQISMPPERSYVVIARNFVGDVAAEESWISASRLDDLRLAVSEAVTNAIVAESEHGGVGTAKQAHEQEVRGCEILELVDQQQSARALCRGPSLGIAQQQLDGAKDLLVEVDLALAGEDLAIAGERVGETIDLAVVARLDLCRIDETEAGE